MYFQRAEHNPPHIHVQHGEYAAAVGIHTKQILSGSLPSKVFEMVANWITVNENKLLEMWETQEFLQLPPLE